MNHLHKYFGFLSIAVACACLGAAPALAQSKVRMQISAQEAYVGMPVTLNIKIEDGDSTSPPEFPEIDGLDIRSTGTPNRSSSVSIINGHRTESNSITFSFQFTPRREGTFEIPPITVKTADGPRRSRPFRISATTSETGDLLFAEVAGQQEKLYVGQPIDLTLRIWLKPYQDKKHNVTISAADMWRMVAQHTQWGAFAETLEKLAAERKTIRGREVLRKDDEGVERSYYLYEVVATFYPKRAGQIDVADVQVVAQYPTHLGQSRDPFESFFGDSPFGGSMFGNGSTFEDDFFKNRGGSPFSRSLTVTAARPIVVTPEVAPIEVTPIPTAGRPADYRGAVGQYEMITQATPTKIKAGDPITLKIGIRGTGPMELVQAPPLSELSTLTADFKVSDEPLAGIVQDDIKVFTTTIRPRREGIAQVPSIPFSFFNPEIEEFVTVQSDSVSIQVDKAEKLALDSIVGSGGSRKSRSASAAPVNAGPVLVNFDGRRVLVSQSAAPDVRFWLAWFVAPVGLLGLFWLVRSHEKWMPKSSTRRPLSQVNRAGEAREVARAILELIADRSGRPANLTRPEAIGEISGQVDSTTTQELERFLVTCENAAFTGDASIPLDQTKHQARRLVEQLAGLQRRSPRTPKVQRPWRILPGTALALVLISVTTYSLLTVFGSAADNANFALARSISSVELDDSQKAILLGEATDGYRRAVETKTNDAAEANSAFAKSAAKYQTLVDSGVHNARLYFNLGNACLQSDSVGRAIANYERSLKLRPLDFQVRRNLEFAQSLVGNPDAGEISTSGITTGVIKTWFIGLSSGVWLTLLTIGWIGICLTVLIRTYRPRWRVRFLAVPALILIFATSGFITWSANLESPLSSAVVVATDIPVYEGSNEAFPQLPNINFKEGDSVRVIQRRGDWLQIRSSTGDQGWTKAELVEQV